MANNKNYRDLYKSEIITKSEPFKYGRCVNFTYGLLLGLLIDKVLFYFTKGASMFVPPFSVLLMNKGNSLFTWRFEKTFNGVFEKLLSHITTK